ncbi:MAG: hypothetical protein GF344_17650 [Chitinivibrionales bacterium]|nr:hypothetical protein [Chitinivibrionales bacterium]MBD3358493.1 hypothetical protein [Chitinivibrionales bacterium]
MEHLVTWVSSRLRGKCFLDVYGGTGLFSIALHDRFESGTLIEVAKPLIARAQENFVRNNIRNIDAVHTSAEQFLAARHSRDFVDCLVVDPPRPGLTRKVRESIRALAPPTLLYVSCNPATQARDVGFFADKCGFKIERGALFDFYPQTHHLESVLLLRR